MLTTRERSLYSASRGQRSANTLINSHSNSTTGIAPSNASSNDGSAVEIAR
jgi:hypothetical protein